MGRGIWWMLASPVQVPRKGRGDTEGLSPAWQASTGGYRIILEQAEQCMYVDSRGGRIAEFIHRRRQGGMGRGNWWMLASAVQVPRKGKGDMEGLSPAWQASTAGYRSILEQANQCMYVCSL